MKYVYISIILLASFQLFGQLADIKELESTFAQVLKEDSKRNQEAFFEAFPGSFGDFIDVYGYENNTPSPLYEKAHQQISRFFGLSELSFGKQMQKWIQISVGGSWEADAVNYFQHSLRIKTKENHQIAYDELIELSDEEVISFFHFFYSGIFPSETVDEEFSSYMTRDPNFYRLIEEGWKSAVQQSKTRKY